MKIPHAAVPRLRLATVLTFVALCGLFFSYLWVNMGGSIPVVSSDGYRVSVELDDVDNLVYDSDVMVAGVRVGKVRELEQSGGVARAVLQLNEDSVTPLHEGATVTVRSKSLVEETYLEVIDGDGEPVDDGGSLPVEAVRPSVQLDQLLGSLDKPTRKNLGRTLQLLGASTKGTREDLERSVVGLGLLGREGHDALGALAAQSEDLKALLRETNRIVRAVDAGEGQLVDLVSAANRLTTSTAQSRSEIEQTVTTLPGVMTEAKAATSSLEELGQALGPVTADVAKAAPALSRALGELPATTRDLRGLLPALDSTLDRAPRTLAAVPGAAGELEELVPVLRTDLMDLNPALAFLKPYGRDLAAFFTNWGAMLLSSDANGHYLRVMPVFNEQTLKGNPLLTNQGFLGKSNAYPKPGGSVDPEPFNGTYPRVERDPR